MQKSSSSFTNPWFCCVFSCQTLEMLPSLVKNGMNEVGWEIREKAEDYYFVSFAFSLVSQPIL